MLTLTLFFSPQVKADDTRSLAQKQNDDDKTPAGTLTKQDIYKSDIQNATRTELGLNTVLDPSLALLPAPVKGPLLSPNDQPLYNFFDRLFVFIGGNALSDSAKNGFAPSIKLGIDSTVHNPWLLNNDTATWRDQFGYNAERFNAGIIATMLPSMAVWTPDRARRDPALSIYTVDDAANIGKTLLGKVAGDIQPDAAIDYGVHELSKYSFFPKTASGWDSVENAIANNGIPVFLTAVAVGGAANLGAVSLGGNFVQLHNKDYSFGWRASVRHFGFSLTPDLRAGPAFTTSKGIEVNASIVEHVNAATGTEQTGLDFLAKFPLVRREKDGNSWDIGILSNGHYFLVDENLKEAGQFRLSTDIYFKKSDLFANGRINQLIGDVNYTTNFETQSTLTASVGIADYNSNTTFAFFARIARDTLTPGGNANLLGVFVSGSLESATPMVQGRMTMAARRVLRALNEIKKQAVLLKTCKSFVETGLARRPINIGPTAAEMRVFADFNQASKECVATENKLNTQHETLREEFSQFLQLRTDYYMHEGRESRNAITDRDGPMSAEEMKDVRTMLHMPEYDSANLGEKNLVPNQNQVQANTVKATPQLPTLTRNPPNPGKTSIQ